MEKINTYKILTLSLLMLLIANFAYSQKMAIRLADGHFRDFRFVDAIEYYEFAFEKDSTNDHVLRRLGEANNKIGNTIQAEKWYKKLSTLDLVTTDDIYVYAQTLKSNGNYRDAEQWMRKYSELNPNDTKASMEVSMLEYIIFLMRDSSKYVIRNLNINTKGSDMGPAYYKEKQLVFSSTSIGNKALERKYSWNQLPYLDLYLAPIMPNGQLGEPQIFAPKIKTNFHDGPITYDEKNNRIFFTRNNFVKGKMKKSSVGDVNLKILFGKYENDEWQYDGSFRFNSDEYSVGHPSIDTTGNVLYFASDMPGGYGGTDIYFTVFSQGRWSKPFNLGPKINSTQNELFPFISKEGILYFSSNGHGGLGGLDIFISVPENGVYNSIENMGYPINSPKDDFGLVLNDTGMEGYFASNRAGGKGDDDLYYLRITRVPIIIKGIVKDRLTELPIFNATVSIISAGGDTINSAFSRTNGEFEFELNKGQDYKVHAFKSSYSDTTTTVKTNGLKPNEEVNVELYLEGIPEEPIAVEQAPTPYTEPLKIEEEDGEQLQVLELEYINYDLDKWDIRQDASEILDRLATIMYDYPDLEIRLESHTDSRGSDEYNLLLSKRRARSAFDYLIEKGIDPNRIQYEGYGETRLLNNCANGVDCSEEEHEVNRRTIVKVVRKGEYRENRRGRRTIFYF